MIWRPNDGEAAAIEPVRDAERHFVHFHAAAKTSDNKL